MSLLNVKLPVPTPDTINSSPFLSSAFPGIYYSFTKKSFARVFWNKIRENVFNINLVSAVLKYDRNLFLIRSWLKFTINGKTLRSRSISENGTEKVVNNLYCKYHFHITLKREYFNYRVRKFIDFEVTL